MTTNRRCGHPKQDAAAEREPPENKDELKPPLKRSHGERPSRADVRMFVRRLARRHDIIIPPWCHLLHALNSAAWRSGRPPQ